ncbi:hypothetical protein [Mesorhizobium sp. LjNodule214]|uniref:hypothetical protein n=1 Tax=Mesorhizobium sp. LjNodule214 TaxID=3342252 RepID=UPI003ECDD6A8
MTLSQTRSDARRIGPKIAIDFSGKHDAQPLEATRSCRHASARLGRPLDNTAITLFSHSLVFGVETAYMAPIDISADRSGLAIFAFADVYPQNLDTTGWTLVRSN